MILNSLVKYYETLPRDENFTEPGYSTASVSYALIITPEGQLKGVEILKHEKLIERKDKKGNVKTKSIFVTTNLIVPEQYVRAVGIRPNFLCDNSTYILGADKKGKPDRSKSCFKASADFHKDVLSGCDCPEARAVIAFFDTWDPDKISEYNFLNPLIDDILGGANIVFKMDDFKLVHENKQIKRLWENYKAADGSGEYGRCLITGDESELILLNPKIKGVSGAQSVGANLVSFNAYAFESYGREKSQGLNAPIGKYAAYAYGVALNRLISDRQYVKLLGDTTVVFWSEDGNETARDWFNQGVFEGIKDDDNELKSIMDNLMHGKYVDSVKVNMNSHFCVLGLAPNAARLSVRFFYRSTFGNLMDNVAQHYQRLKIKKPPTEFEYLTPYWLLKETVSPVSKDQSASPLLAGAVMRAIINNTPYPVSLYNSVLVRIRADRDISPGKAAIIKAYLLKNSNNPKIKEEITVSLNEGLNNRAYILGRLFSVLEKAQSEANPNINTTIKDRYFTSACATPQLVFPYLIKLSTHHIAKAKYGDYTERDIRALIDRLEYPPFPARLNNEEQGYFIQGYYQQTQQRYNKKAETTIKNESEGK